MLISTFRLGDINRPEVLRNFDVGAARACVFAIDDMAAINKVQWHDKKALHSVSSLGGLFFVYIHHVLHNMFLRTLRRQCDIYHSVILLPSFYRPMKASTSPPIIFPLYIFYAYF